MGRVGGYIDKTLLRRRSPEYFSGLSAKSSTLSRIRTVGSNWVHLHKMRTSLTPAMAMSSMIHAFAPLP